MEDKLIILRDLKGYLQNRYDDSVKDIILFGSQLYGNPNENSDFDVLIILDKGYSSRDEKRIYDLCYDIDLKYNIVIDVHLISKQELNTLRGKQPIYVKILKTGLYA